MDNPELVEWALPTTPGNPPPTPLTATPRVHSSNTRTPSDVSALFKELVDKLSWSVGSTFKERYGRRTRIRTWAVKMANEVLAWSNP